MGSIRSGGTWRAVAAACVLVVVVAGCSSEGTKVSRADLGDEWPLTVASVMLECLPSGEVVAQWEGTGYMLAGEVDHSAYSDIAPIWARDAAGTLIPLRALRDRGLELCD